MSFNKFKKRKNKIYNFIKHVFFGNGQQQRKIISGKAKGINLYVDPLHNIQRLSGAYEHEILATFANWAKVCNCFFDIGAGDGYYSLLYKKYNPAGEAYLFDADKNLEEIQKKHFALNNIICGFHLYFKMITGKNDEEQVFFNALSVGNKTILIKIDVEGAEASALESLDNLLSENECRLIIETHSLLLEKQCIDFLGRLGYRMRIIKNAWWRLILPERRPLEHNRWLVAWKIR